MLRETLESREKVLGSDAIRPAEITGEKAFDVAVSDSSPDAFDRERAAKLTGDCWQRGAGMILEDLEPRENSGSRTTRQTLSASSDETEGTSEGTLHAVTFVYKSENRAVHGAPARPCRDAKSIAGMRSHRTIKIAISPVTDTICRSTTLHGRCVE